MFTDAIINGNGMRLAKYIRKHGLGTIVETTHRKNPNSGNTMKVWLWGINHKRLKEWHGDNPHNCEDMGDLPD